MPVLGRRRAEHIISDGSWDPQTHRLSNATLKQVEQARGIVEIVCVQNQYNLAHRGDDPLIDALAADDIAYVPFFPLGGFSPLQSETLSDVAARLGATPIQVALAWLLRRSSNRRSP